MVRVGHSFHIEDMPQERTDCEVMEKTGRKVVRKSRVHRSLTFSDAIL